MVPQRLEGGLSTSAIARRYPWQPHEQELPFINWHCHTETSVEAAHLTPYLTMHKPKKEGEGVGARICKDSL